MAKRQTILVSLILCFLGLSAQGQNMYDALNFSNNEYFGSARTLGIGNAVTAIGGDLGTIGINPAGSAVSNYGQFTFSFGTNTSSSKADFSIFGDDIVDNTNSSKMTKFSIPNIGASCVIYTGAQRGLKSISMAFVINQTANYTYQSLAFANNPVSSKFGEMASAASGIDPALLSNYNSFYNTDISWDLLTAYQGGLYNRVLDTYDYAGVTEGVSHRDDNSLYMYNAGDINQTSLIAKTGSKNDIILNFGANISDKLYLGANIGLPYARYSSAESFYENAVNPDQFPNIFLSNDGTLHSTNFIKARNIYQYIADVEGVYAKIGAIYTLGGLRLGAAYQTPSILNVSERWKYFSATYFSDSYYNTSQESPEGEYTYTLRTPSILNLGVAYTIGQMGFVSVDYQLSNYSTMKFKYIGNDLYSGDTFQPANESIKNFAGLGRSLRIGAEFRLGPRFSLRAGYNSNITEEYSYIVDNVEVYASDYQADFDSYFVNRKALLDKSTHLSQSYRVSFGFGYSSGRSFFMDFAASLTEYPRTSYNPYYLYLAYNAAGEELGYVAPCISTNNKLINAVLTLGWRF